MDNCVLCLDENNYLEDYIKINSTLWQELNIQHLIEKHLWSLDTMLTTNSSICKSCWHELYEFHKFYKRIEKLHRSFDATMCNMDVQLVEKELNSFENSVDIKECTNLEYGNDPLVKDDLIEYKFETDSLMNQSDVPLEMVIDDQAFIKNEPHDNIINNSKESGDPLRKNINCNKRKRKKKELFVKSKTPEVSNEADHDSVQILSNIYELQQNLCYELPKTNEEKDNFVAKNYKISCELCDKQLETFSNVCKHFEEEHDQPGYVICCKQKLSSRSILIDHLHCHLNPDHFKCNYCNRILSDRPTLDEHIKDMHMKEDWHDCCNICGERFADIHQLKNHKLLHNLQESGNYKLPQSRKEMNEFLRKNYKISCILCDQPMESFSILCKHFKTEHNQMGYVICCNKKFGTRSILVDHVHSHINPDHFKCNHCGRVMSDRQCLETHIRKIHVGNLNSLINQSEVSLEIIIDDQAIFKDESQDGISKTSKEPSEMNNDDPLMTTDNFNKIKKRKRMKIKDLFVKSNTSEVSNEADHDNGQILSNINEFQQNLCYELPKTNEEKDNFVAQNYKISCELCDEEQETFSDLCIHFKKEHDQTGYVICCKKKFSSRSILIDHLHCHLNSDHFKCHYCNRILSDRQTLEKHIMHMHMNQDWHDYCNICGDGFADIYQLKTHKLSHNLQEGANHELPQSNEEKDEFLRKNYKISCILCGQPMETFDILCKHFKTEHNKPGYVICCDKKFGIRSILVDHVHRHLNPDHFKCNHCGKVMSDRQCLETHIRKMHVGHVVKNHCCDICGKAFSNSSGLKLHKLVHVTEEEKKVPCKECGKNFATDYLLSQHVKSIHLKKYVKICDICGKSIKYANLFERHMREHKGNPLPMVSCDICGRWLTDKQCLKRHKQRSHSVEKLVHRCDICSKEFNCKYTLRKHISSKHENGYEKDNRKCTICEKYFNRPQALRDHMARHAGTALHSCPWCTKSFYSNGHMHAHRKKDHPKEWEEAQRQKFSGNLPPNYKPPITNDLNKDLS